MYVCMEVYGSIMPCHCQALHSFASAALGREPLSALNATSGRCMMAQTKVWLWKKNIRQPSGNAIQLSIKLLIELVCQIVQNHSSCHLVLVPPSASYNLCLFDKQKLFWQRKRTGSNNWQRCFSAPQDNALSSKAWIEPHLPAIALGNSVFAWINASWIPYWCFHSWNTSRQLSRRTFAKIAQLAKYLNGAQLSISANPPITQRWIQCSAQSMSMYSTLSPTWLNNSACNLREAISLGPLSVVWQNTCHCEDVTLFEAMASRSLLKSNHVGQPADCNCF